MAGAVVTVFYLGVVITETDHFPCGPFLAELPVRDLQKLGAFFKRLHITGGIGDGLLARGGVRGCFLVKKSRPNKYPVDTMVTITFSCPLRLDAQNNERVRQARYQSVHPSTKEKNHGSI